MPRKGSRKPGRPTRSGKPASQLKQEVIHHLSRGCGIVEACRLAGTTRSSYYGWRKADPEFKADAERLLRDPVHQERILRGQAIAASETGKSWQEKFIATYLASGDREQALVASAQSALHIEACLSPDSEHYDAAFHRAFQQAEQRRLWRIEDNLLNKAEHDSPSARFILANRVKGKYGKLEGTTTVQNAWFSVEGESRAAERLRKMFGNGEHDSDDATRLLDDRPAEKLVGQGGAAG